MIDRLAIRMRMSLSHPINTSAVIIMAFYTTLWGLWVACPSWNVFERASLYQVMSTLAPEWFWGTLAIICGLIMLWGVARHSFNSLTFGAFVGFIHWLLIALLYFVGDWQSTGGITSLMVSVYCAFVYLNLQINKKSFPFMNVTPPPVD